MIEIVATGLPVHQGIPLAVDVTMVSPLHADGSAWAWAATRAGVALERAVRNKHRTYGELVANPVLWLVVAATEVGGRCNHEVLQLLNQAATAKA
eukprot:9502691-Pyramimonas_sp.AAC.1